MASPQTPSCYKTHSLQLIHTESLWNNQFKWLNWDPNSAQAKKDGEKIHQPFIEWLELVNEGAIAAADTEGATFKRWFGVQDDADERALLARRDDWRPPVPDVCGMESLRGIAPIHIGPALSLPQSDDVCRLLAC
ncbi:hypothetical protein GJ744_007903 [Endocarpon pusillum]|uniref:Uncharacterized protein n=1 Tax=Endocarpon pusillum TaxID=364733 RepID=A0A8H7E610_9EURO|nr:hypothetical protein GJ744_007903 [Endocarpon pusillum]